MFGYEETFPSDTDWDAVLQEAKAQSIVGITSKALPSDVPSSVLLEWNKLAYAQLANTIRYWKAQDELHQLLTENSISYVILKGAAAAMLYPDPFSRAMGDIDFLVASDQFDRAKELLEGNGYKICHEGNDRHICFSKDRVSYELHRRFSYDDLDMEDILQAAIPHAELHQAAGHEFCTFPARENGLVLLAHLWNHLHTGVGLRQVLDWMLFVKGYATDEFWNTQFFDLAKQCHLEKTAIVAACMCRKYFKLPVHITWCHSAEEELCDELMETVLEYGNFGRKVSNNKAEVKAQIALTGFSRYGIFRHLQNRGEINWTAYHSHPWLRPFAWLYQLFRYVVLWLTSPKNQKITSLIQKETKTNNLLKRLSS